MTTIVLRVTRSQQMALIDILIDYIRMPEHTEQFIDVANDVTTTPGELLSLVSSLQEVETSIEITWNGA